MGLAILPARLKTELAEIESIVAGALESNDSGSINQDADMKSSLFKALSENEKTASHADWVMESVMKDGINSSNIHDILRQEVGSTFAKVLECAGVYKCTDEGREAFMRFIDTI
jgi:UDPglucose--hexose-1-phosphate uridylyltransferase